MPTALQLFGTTMRMLKSNWKLFGGIALVFGVINVVFVQSLGTTSDFANTKSTFDTLFTGNFANLFSNLASFASLMSTSGQSSDPSTGSYQAMWVLIVSLATIWALREAYAGRTIKIRDAFYNGMYPLVPFVLVMMVIALEFIPLVVGATLFTTVIGNGIAVTGVEIFIWAFLFFLLALLSIFMVSSTMFALYISCQPGVKPMQALRSTKQLVTNRRWAIIRKILFLPFIVLLLNALIIMPVIAIFAPAALWVFYVVSMFNMMIIHAYYYTLYRSLLV